MNNDILTNVVTDLVNKYAVSQEYGISLVNIPDYNYNSFISKLTNKKKIEVFFLGFSNTYEEALKESLPCVSHVNYSFSVEDAEASRNSGDENIFRVLILKRIELEKISSLRWFPEVGLETVYTKSCDYIKRELKNSNVVIEALIQALRCKPIRSLLSFERVIDYLEILFLASESLSPEIIKNNFYKLGLLSDRNITNNNPEKNDFVNRIKRNHAVVERISNLEQKERQSITNYYAKSTIDNNVPKLILSYYKTKNIEILKSLDLEEVEACLKAVKERPIKPPKPNRKSEVEPTEFAIDLVFDEKTDIIDDILNTIRINVDDRNNSKKNERVEIDYGNSQVQVKVNATTEKIAEQVFNDDMGGVIRVNVDSPDEAIHNLEKFDYMPFKEEYLNSIKDDLKKLSTILSDGEQISGCLDKFLVARSKIVQYTKRLQDVPMLQILSKQAVFEEYIRAYEKLLLAINEDFPKIWGVASSNAKAIINAVMSIDYYFVIGENKFHAIPTPLHPLYLWKYVELAKEILSSRGLDSMDEGYLSDEDKAFICRKAADIPDPLSVMLLPVSITERDASFLPLAGRMGILPVYSNVPQINQSESGIYTLKKAIIRYICLYPHAGLMLRLCFIDPPSVEVIVTMLKALNADKEFNINGIDVTIFRTKEVPEDWNEIDNESLNEGLLGKYKGQRSLRFNLKIVNKRRSYSQILSELNNTQHLMIVFDPNEVKIETAQNSRYIHIHPLCIPKVYKYNPLNEEVEIRPASEGGIFTLYSSIIEKLNERPSMFSHTSTFFRTPIKQDTYNCMLTRADWLVILDQSLKSWDISLRSASEKLFYRENDYRSVGIYSGNCKKFVIGYDSLVKQLGNFIPREEGIKEVINAIRSINDDGLLSIVSHVSNRIFDEKHGKGSLGTAIAAISYKKSKPESILVGLDTQLAQEWLSEREEGKLPDLVAININSDDNVVVDLIEVKTYSGNSNSFQIIDGKITGHAVEQVTVLEKLIHEMFSSTERITTISRKEVLREQVFECLFHSDIESIDKLDACKKLNNLFAGKYRITVNKIITFVDFENPQSTVNEYEGFDSFVGNKYCLKVIGSEEIQSILKKATNDNQSNDIVIRNNGNEEIDNNHTFINVNMSRNPVIDERSNNVNVEAEVSESKQVLDNEDTLNETTQERIANKCAKLNKVFKDYGIRAEEIDVSMVQEAARFMRFPIRLKSGETVNSLNRYKNDIGIQLEANGEILIEHMKGTSFISLDIPFADSDKSISLIKHLNVLDETQGRLSIIAGQTPDGRFDILDIADAPHMLIAGTTGSGKTIFLQSILVSLLYQFSEKDLELLIIDPKQTDFVFFEGLPNLYGGKVVIDAEDALQMLQKINNVDKEERTKALRECRSKDIDSYNKKNPNKKMKRIVVIIDEYSDLIQAAEMQGTRKEFEKNLLMLLQRVRNLGIHLIIATQRPSSQIVTGALKAVIPFRVSFRLPSHTDSQTILDKTGAETLLGKGDMLIVTETEVKRMQGLFVSEEELEAFLSNKISH